jgi:putative transposase
MARPLRIEYPGALYHVTSRGNDRGRIFRQDSDKSYFLELFGDIIKRYHWLCHSYCLMDNHYHLIIETPEGNLARGMRQINGIYTQKHNWIYRKTGHVFQGRYKAILVDRDSYLLELCRYVVLNPVRAGIVKKPDDWHWSSYRLIAGIDKPPKYFTTDWILAQFGTERTKAETEYRQFVLMGMKEETPWKALKGQVFLGDQHFIDQMMTATGEKSALAEVPRIQRYANRPELSDVFMKLEKSGKDKRDAAIYDANIRYGYTLKEIAAYLEVHYTTVSKVVKKEINKN